MASTEPLLEFLATAGCLRHLKCLEDKELLVQDILMFQVVHRVRGPFERFRDGLRTLGVLDQIKMYPESFRSLLCHQAEPLTADMVDKLFIIRLSPAGSNRRAAEEVVVPFWRDYLQDVEDEHGPEKLSGILSFATGATEVPPTGFSPNPSIEFIHGPSNLPIANTCVNCLKLPLLQTYSKFKERMDFAVGNTYGFGQE
ncbi:G2/M phase-specific E3 ubiquitin-protein ligase-like [Neoarius graeffei]|uniref:G2/M phase-specific E3 ubiquitin-protein ligase-like n=1 Tax=Neoarius graeffei TaxID=443677 RepID=UPI00298C5CB7|nr:G2/M phase-specific E3 ubiquitin-protein ligase-like [Neoarius graeffei]